MHIGDNTQIIKRYLLGMAGDDEQQWVEEQLFLDDDYYEKVQTVEDDLIEDYLGESLVNKERAAFKRHFMKSPEQQAKVEQARLLRRYFLAQADDSTKLVINPEEPQPSNRKVFYWRLPFASYAFSRTAVILGAIIVIALFGNVLWNRWNEQERILQNQSNEQAALEGKSAQLQTELQRQQEQNQNLAQLIIKEQQQRVEQEQEIARLKSSLNVSKTPSFSTKHESARNGNPSASKRGQKLDQTVRPRIVTYELAAGQTMGIGSINQDVLLSSDIKSLRFKLEIEPDQYPHYQAAVRDEDGRIVWQQNNLAAQGNRTTPRVVVTLPVKILLSSNYKVMLVGITADAASHKNLGTYYFRILRQ